MATDPGKLLRDAVQELHQATGSIPEGAMTIKDVMEFLSTETQPVSYHKARLYLKKLVGDGKVTKIRRGKNVNYYIFKE